jgi:uncharacterized protein (DUF1501 family)
MKLNCSNLSLSRRDLLRVGAVTLSGCAETLFPSGLKASTEEKVQPRGSADCVVFVNLVGGPSQMDTFDLKESKTTPADLDVRVAPNGVRWPYGLLPKTGAVLNDTVLVRSMAAWDTLHNFGQYYQQVGHAYSAARASEMPSMGSIIAREFKARAKPSDFLPAFVAMNFPTSSVNGPLIKEGSLSSDSSPLTVDLKPGTSLPFLLAPGMESRFDRRMEALESFDSMRQLDAAYVPKRFLEWESFTKSAQRMMKSPDIGKVFTLDAAQRARYGNTPMGDACLIARNIIAANAGTRYILINQGGWDHHAAIYGKADQARGEDPKVRGGLYQLCAELDSAFSSLVTDLKAASLLERTFIVCTGEFGRTPGALNDAKGRDHWPNVRSALFAGGGVAHPGRILGATDDAAAQITRFDWSKKRPIYPEDVSATIYSVLGIDWTKKITGMPSGRDFQYVEPMSSTGFIGSTEIKELFTA